MQYAVPCSDNSSDFYKISITRCVCPGVCSALEVLIVPEQRAKGPGPQNVAINYLLIHVYLDSKSHPG